MSTQEQVLELLAQYRGIKEHTWSERGERNLLPSVALIFRDAGLWNANFEGLIPFFVEQVKKQAETLPEHLREQVGNIDLEDNVIPLALDFMFYCVWRGSAPGIPDAPNDKLESVMFVADGYTRTVRFDTTEEAEVAADSIERGDLGRAFSNDPDTDVTECLTVSVFTDDLVGGVEEATACQTYAITDGGVVTWGEVPEVLISENEGAISHTVRKHFHGRQP